MKKKEIRDFLISVLEKIDLDNLSMRDYILISEEIDYLDIYDFEKEQIEDICHSILCLFKMNNSQ